MKDKLTINKFRFDCIDSVDLFKLLLLLNKTGQNQNGRRWLFVE